MKKLSLIVLPVFILACAQIIPTPNDFPPPPPTTIGVMPPPVTAIIEWTGPSPTSTLEPRLRPVLTDDMADAQTFLLILKTSLAAGDDIHVAEMTKYPLRVKLNGQQMLFNNSSEFLASYKQIFTPEFIDFLFGLDEEKDLTLLPDGIRVAHGELWFNYFCTDMTCSDAQFLLTQINR
jgi:hypothetical protein